MSYQPFDYTQARVNGLTRAMSADRFQTYLDAAASEPAALRLYTWNVAAATSFHGPLLTAEVALRNAINDNLASSHGARWFDDGRVLRPAELRLVGDATQLLNDRGKRADPGRVVAELSFGFWVALFANAYDQTLWRSDLFKLLPPAARNRHALHDTLDRMRTLRNRIAHHEPIFQRKLSEDYTRIRKVVQLLSPLTLEWLDHHSTVPKLLTQRPDQITSF